MSAETLASTPIFAKNLRDSINPLFAFRLWLSQLSQHDALERTAPFKDARFGAHNADRRESAD